VKAQTRMASLRESGMNIVVGFAIQFAANYFILPLFGLHPSVADLFGLGGIFTVISVVRSYVLRRVFEKKRAADVPPHFQPVMEEIARERTRQIEGEGYGLAHDDGLRFGELAKAAAAYALLGHCATALSLRRWREHGAALWPFDPALFRPTTPRRCLIKAAAMIIAEIGRLDRAATRRPA
jgi:hypothetical protein